MEKEKVAIYCRLSVEDIDKINKGDESESIQNQKLLLLDYSKKKGWSVYKIYSDEDYSGLDGNRPQFKQMIEDAKNGSFHIVLCKTQSRFTRDMELVEKYLHGLFIIWGIRFISVIDNVDTNIKGSKKARQINGLINEWYCEDLSENIRSVFKKKMEDGQFIGSFAPYGYQKDKNNHHKLIIDEEAAEIVREIFSLYIEGKGAYKISKILTERGIMTPSLYKIKKGFRFYNPHSQKYSIEYNIWAANSVRRILKNEVYIGTLIQGKERKVSYKSKKIIATPKQEWICIENNHSPIIDKKTFDLVQDLSGRKISAAVPKNGAKKYIYGGKIKCEQCGANMEKGAYTRNKQSFYIRCSNAKKTKMCTSHSIIFNIVEEIVELRIRQIIFDFCETESNRLMVLKYVTEKSGSQNKLNVKQRNIINIFQKIENLKRALTSVYMDKINGLLTEEEFKNVKELLNNDNIKLKKEYETDKKEIIKLEAELAVKLNIKNDLKKLINITQINHSILNNFVDYIQIGEVNEYHQQEITIHWMF